jgi:hypothetical protein
LDEISQGPKRDPRFPYGRWLAAAAAAGLIAATAALLVTSTTPATPGASPRSPVPGRVTAPPGPSPVSAGASLPSTCVVGYTPSPRGPAFVPGPPPQNPARTTIQGAAYPTAGYQLTLSNDSAATVRITGFRTVFYDPHGTQVGSDEETINEVFLSTGQSFTWREYSEVDTEGSGSGLGIATIPATSATCQLVTLYSPAAS